MYKSRKLPNTRIDVADALRGMQLGRQRLFYNEGRHLKIWHNILFCSAIVVPALSFVDFCELDSWLKPIFERLI